MHRRRLAALRPAPSADLSLATASSPFDCPAHPQGRNAVVSVPGMAIVFASSSIFIGLGVTTIGP